MSRTSLAAAVATLLCVASPSLANTITVTSSAIPALTLSPSSDSISFNAGSVTMPGPGTVVLQTGTFSVGDSQIVDQVIPFSFSDILTIDGISRTLTISGQDNVTTTADILTFFAGSPVNFGPYVLTLNQTSFTAANLGSYPINLSADVSPTPAPEPAPLLLLATGLTVGVVALRAAGKRASAASACA